MNKFIPILFIFFGCSSIRKHPIPENLVTVQSALNQAQMSYLKGCVDARKELNASPIFNHCRDRAKDHLKEINEIMNSPINE